MLYSKPWTEEPYITLCQLSIFQTTFGCLEGLEPSTSRATTWRSHQPELQTHIIISKNNCTFGRIRTYNSLILSQVPLPFGPRRHVYRQPDSNRHGLLSPTEFKSVMSTKFHHDGIYNKSKINFNKTNISNKIEKVKFYFGSNTGVEPVPTGTQPVILPL